MLSTKTRLLLEQIAERIQNGEEVSLEDMIFAEKWAKSNRSAAEIIRKARSVDDLYDFFKNDDDSMRRD